MKTIKNNTYAHLPITDLKITETKCKEIAPQGTIDLTDEEFAKSKKINEFLNKGVVTVIKDYTLNKVDIMNKARIQKAVDKSVNPLKKQIDSIAQVIKEKINRLNGSEQTKQVQTEVEDLKKSIVEMQKAQSLMLDKLENLKVTTVINNVSEDKKTNKKTKAIEEEIATPIFKDDLDTKNIKKKKIKVKSKSSKKNINDTVKKLKSLKKKK